MKRLFLLLLGTGLLLGCRKDDLLFVGDPADSSNALSSVLLRNAPSRQVFSFALGQAQTLRTAAGATISLPANAFILPNGNVATGQAELRVREIYSVPDMLLADMPTTAIPSRQMLISGGEFNIQVWQGGSRLRMSAFSPTGLNRLSLTSPVPTAGLDTTRMYLWKQPTSISTGTPGDSSGWQQFFYVGAIANARTPVQVPAAAGSYAVAFPLDSIGSWNIDQFWHYYQNSPSSSIGITVPAGATATRVYFRPVGFNGLARCYAAANSTTRWNSLLPLGADMIAVVLQEQNGQLYYGTQRVTTTAGLVVNPPLQALSAAEIIQRIRQL